MDPEGIMDQLGAPDKAGFDILYRADDLTIINFVWAPAMELHAHNHNIWAAIGIYAGVEENTFYIRKAGSIVKQNTKHLAAGDAVLLGENVIHSVRNPGDVATGGIHVYGGDFVSVARSEWDMQTWVESPYDMDHTREVFADANRRWQAE